jgi:hypothetical protein
MKEETHPAEPVINVKEEVKEPEVVLAESKPAIKDTPSRANSQHVSIKEIDSEPEESKEC